MQIIAVLLLIGIIASAGIGENHTTNKHEGTESMTSKANQIQYDNAYQAGQTKRNAGNYTEARKDFEKALTLAGAGPERAKALLGIGEAYDAEALSKIATGYFKEQLAAARVEFEKALAINDSTPDQKAQAHYSIGTGHLRLRQYTAARVELEKAVATAGASATWRVQAQMSIGRSYTRWSDNKPAEAMAAFAKVLTLPGVSPIQKAEAHMAIAGVLTHPFAQSKNYAEARAELAKILKIPDIPPASLALARIAIGKTWFSERNYAAARDELSKALSMEGVLAADKVEMQLYLGLSYYEAKDYEHAGDELRKVLEMPGAQAGQIHEAKLRLCLRKLLPGDEKFLTVLFIGASHTQVWKIPQIVETLSTSAPAGRPRIIAGEFTRGGTMINQFWEDGAGPGTARDRIAADPWDYLVMETFFTMSQDDLVKYGTLFINLIRSQNGRPVIYESPVNYSQPYPDAFQKFHDKNTALGKTLKAPVAPSVYAWMLYLGPNPTPEQRLALYHADAVHTSKKGAYMAACCIYSAVTGLSPVGLTHAIPSFAPDGISKEEAETFQKIAWEAYRQTNRE